MPNRRAASRWLSPSTWQAWRTRPYSSTENIPAFPGSFRTNQGKPCRGTTLYRHGRTTQPSQWHIIPAPLSGAVVGADVARHAAQDEQIGQDINHVHGLEPARHPDRQALVR